MLLYNSVDYSVIYYLFMVFFICMVKNSTFYLDPLVDNLSVQQWAWRCQYSRYIFRWHTASQNLDCSQQTHEKSCNN